ncbi:twin-arginine translocation signal domain-containing protein [Microbacterium sp.]|uniref:twin-arginine translocation signal domain-containing protein n=1 Tax=Microbacterium sp. TaxID=51671 RepID=UPI002E3093EE|nr:twin-arginine translocation signal domain-containing protein [Microbacterium sp.]HEX5729578.1 twin-arginine translocation signal domain-containing protein [Microbacterium sp.]
MTSQQPPLSRRTVLKLAAAAGWSLGGLLLVPSRSRPGRAGTVVSGSTAPGGEEAAPAPRYRFDCVTPVPAFAPLGRLEEVWASPRYMTFTDCTVTYVGEGPHSLTAEESAIVDVVANAGGDAVDREATYLLVLRASTRVDPSRLSERLWELGRPVVEGSLALAPDAPQARLFAEWLDAAA